MSSGILSFCHGVIKRQAIDVKRFSGSDRLSQLTASNKKGIWLDILMGSINAVAHATCGIEFEIEQTNYAL